MSTTSTPERRPDTSRGTMRIATVAAHLDVSRRTVWRLIEAGELDAVRPSSTVTLVTRASVEAYLARLAKRDASPEPPAAGAPSAPTRSRAAAKVSGDRIAEQAREHGGRHTAAVDRAIADARARRGSP